ncbi:cation channel sperm-associated protein subunit epsilon-like isoform X2 [Actinia tenebrosa]|uniref:Cation channel sperm-associated protein subunit epsilon-like isoform X1 n=1 Tax=Actinia tenebrosa TaxID=6105 RepID=A0A6P8IGN8_ACTTE|nr:cation channel sperm-associated protein subunit epsilon-like isoform X1 [Actinia tenebrosa]XP_031565987.1 cation channel sperm-associated protein subunit epsilon-like isoform X2 [Actinia tenebrosa]
MILLLLVLSFAIFVGGLAFQDDSGSKHCLKHQVLIHDIKEKYFMDRGETIEIWAKIVHDLWKDNRLIAGVSDPSSLSFNLSCVQQATEFKGVVTRNMTAVIYESDPKPTYISNRTKNSSGEFEFYIKAFSQDDCNTAKVSTKIIVGCPTTRRLQIHGRTFEGCDEYKVYNYTIQREQFNGNTSKVVHYDFKNLGCPITSIINSQFKPTVHRYDNDKFVTEVTGDFLLWEKHGRNSYHYSRTMRQAGCVRAPQEWSEMIDGLKAIEVDREWKQQVHHSCFNLNGSNFKDDSNMDMPYEITNSTGGSAVIWNDGGLYVFKLRIIDPHTSFCDLTAEFAVNVGFTDTTPEHVPTFVVLGASCLGILLGTVVAYLIDAYCLC